MDDLIFFGKPLDRIEDKKAVKDLEPDPTVVKLRQRLLSSNYGDSIDSRINILAEIVFRTYIHQLQLLKE